MATGKRAGSRKGTRPKRKPRPALFVLALGVTLAVATWGYLVYAAIDFGIAGRGGDSQAWAFCALAMVGAVACLFVGLMLVARLARAIGLTSPPGPKEAEQPRPVGGRRVAR